MKNKLAAILIVLGFLFSTSAGYFVQAQSSLSIGVKKGDWMEYTVSGSGNLLEGHDIVWAKIEIVEIASNGSKFWANVVSLARNGSLYTAIRDFDFATGDVDTWIFIPANLNPGDSFYDQFSNSSLTIQGEKTVTIAGASRTVTYANTTERYKEWDKATGMYIQTIDTFPDHEISANITATNIWSPQILGLDQNVFYIVLAVIVTAVVAVPVTLLVTAFRRKR